MTRLLRSMSQLPRVRKTMHQILTGHRTAHSQRPHTFNCEVACFEKLRPKRYYVPTIRPSHNRER
eukprot:6460106-Amphidinium_carterae.2